MVKVNYDLESKKVLGFYPDFINYNKIPEPYIEVSDEKHAELVEMANSGKELYVKSIKDKEFALRDIIVSQEQTVKNRITELKNLLAETDYQAIKYAEGQLSSNEYASMKAQRQAWRDEINELETEV